MKALNLSKVEEAGEYEKLVPGGYVCQIKTVRDDTQKEYLEIEYDIAEGKFKDYFKGLNASLGFWGGKLIRSYKPNALPFFKAMTTALKQSNPSFVWDDDGQNDERTMIGKYIGLVLGEEEYVGADGTVKKRLRVAATRSVSAIRQNNYKVPELKILPEGSRPKPAVEVTPVADDDLPF